MAETDRPTSDLRVRVTTAVILALIVLGTLAWGGRAGWAALVAVFALAAAWEGARLVGVRPGATDVPALVLGVGAVVAALVLFLVPTIDRDGLLTRLWLGLAVLYWAFFVPIALAQTRIPPGGAHRSLALALVIGAAVLSVVLLRERGVAWLVGALVIAIVADVAGYFVGRRWGRVKLAPQVSPKKTREGAFGGVAAASVWVGVVAWFTGLAQGAGSLSAALIVGALLGVFSILGDLWESQLKRQAGVKDASNLLPGHGGVLDRIDAQLAVLPAVALLLIVLGRLP